MKVFKSYIFYTTFLLVLGLDQITKYLVVSNFSLYDRLSVIPGIFNLTLAYNKGVAFGVFSGLSDATRPIMLTIVTLLAFAVLIYLLVKQYSEDKIAWFAIAGIFGGAIGNLIDRFVYGHVIDFLDFYLNSYHWPAFNVADSCICVGVLILLVRPEK